MNLTQATTTLCSCGIELAAPTPNHCLRLPLFHLRVLSHSAFLLRTTFVTPFHLFVALAARARFVAAAAEPKLDELKNCANSVV